MARPAIDPLFRSAGVSAGPGAIGVLLSGMLNDGASGLADLKRCGGVTIVQSPLDAVESEMPRTALRASDIDYRAGTSHHPALSRSTRADPDAAAQCRDGSEDRARPTNRHAFHCRDRRSGAIELSGMRTLSQIRRSPLRFRCQVGHSYTAQVLAHEQEGSVDEAVRMALRVMGERAVLMEKMTADALEAGRTAAAVGFEERAQEYRRSAVVLMDAALKGRRQLVRPSAGCERARLIDDDTRRRRGRARRSRAYGFRNVAGGSRRSRRQTPFWSRPVSSAWRELSQGALPLRADGRLVKAKMHSK